jgi:hypothetical protein
LFKGSVPFSKGSQPIVTIFLIRCRKVVALEVLLYVLQLDTIVGTFYAILLLEFQVKIMEAIAMYIRNKLRLLNNSYDAAIIPRNYHGNHRMRQLYGLLVHQVIKNG